MPPHGADPSTTYVCTGCVTHQVRELPTTLVDKPTTLVDNKPTTLVDKPTTLVDNKPTTLVDKSTTLVDKSTTLVDNKPTTLVDNKPTTLVDKSTTLVDKARFVDEGGWDDTTTTMGAALRVRFEIPPGAPPLPPGFAALFAQLTPDSGTESTQGPADAEEEEQAASHESTEPVVPAVVLARAWVHMMNYCAFTPVEDLQIWQLRIVEHCCRRHSLISIHYATNEPAVCGERKGRKGEKGDGSLGCCRCTFAVTTGTGGGAVIRNEERLHLRAHDLNTY
eukprot:1196075-Prorocentrum_minimum.AAC.4